jgi:chemotaxis protein MotB
LEKKCVEEKRKNAEIGAELSSKDSTLAELKQDLQSSESYGQFMDEGAIDRENELAGLQSRLSKLDQEKHALETRLNQLTAASEADVNELKEGIQNRDADISKLQAELKRADSQLSSLKEEMESGRRQVGELQARLSELGGEKARITTKIDKMESSYQSLLSDLKKQITNKEVTIQRIKERMTITFVDRILFEFGKATITPEGKENLRKVGKALRNVGDRMIEVVGHTDDIPIMNAYRWKFPSNWELSTDRAAAVVRYFQDSGIDPANMEAVGRSSYDPVAGNETPEGRAGNRRVNIIIAPKIAPEMK